jgi:hypothetical protein
VRRAPGRRGGLGALGWGGGVHGEEEKVGLAAEDLRFARRL